MVLSSASNSLILQHESRGGGVDGWKGGEEWEGITDIQRGRVSPCYRRIKGAHRELPTATKSATR